MVWAKSSTTVERLLSGSAEPEDEEETTSTRALTTIRCEEDVYLSVCEAPLGCELQACFTDVIAAVLQGHLYGSRGGTAQVQPFWVAHCFSLGLSLAAEARHSVACWQGRRAGSHQAAEARDGGCAAGGGLQNRRLRTLVISSAYVFSFDHRGNELWGGCSLLAPLC